MTSIKTTLVAACAVSLLGIGAAYAQTDPNAAPAMAPAAPAADASGDAMMKKPMMKKKMHKKHMAKKMMKQKTM